jgi:D-glycero-D-manno-heptose 1,7-bisphosphate phosphatase
MVNKAVFFDRDGVLNHLVERTEGSTAPWGINEFEFVDGAKEAVALVKKLGYHTFVVTNQPDVYDGMLPQSHLDLMSRLLYAWLRVDEVLVAYERGSVWYKPNNGMIETLVKKYDVDRGSSYIIGDRWKDIVAGKKSKLGAIFVGEEYTYPYEYKEHQPDYIVANVVDAAKLIYAIDAFMEPKYD